jgi:peptidyl-dipeptidase A
MFRRSRASSAVSCLFIASSLLVSGCDKGGEDGDTTAPPKTEPSAEDAAAAEATEKAKAFVTRVDAELRAVWVESSEKAWQNATDITPEHEAAAAKASEAVLTKLTELIGEAKQHVGAKVDDATARQLHLLRISTALPAPADAAKRAELAALNTEMESFYGKAKACTKGKGKAKCRDLDALSKTLAESRKPKELAEAWTAWHDLFGEMGPKYARFVELANVGAVDMGFKDTGDLWRSGYDMAPDEFSSEMERLWTEVEPLYRDLHCHVRAKLVEKYGEKVVDPKGPIPAHLLGNMWAQEWTNVYPLMEPYAGQPSIDVTAALKKKGLGPLDMVKKAEAFFVSLGMDPLPATFWERSMFEKPKDREVVCHASAWDVGFNDDLRIKMCIKVDAEDFVTIHHELGHDYYFHYYYKLPVLFQAGANDGFHEGIGDTLALSVTPAYLKEIGLLESASEDPKSVVNQQMQVAMQKVAFLPFGLLIDKWRWEVFAGKIAPADYSKAWWEMKRKYQGVVPPNDRGAGTFDPGAKYHIPGNTPYARYFLAHVLQFQFHEALCKAAGHEGPLHTCSIYGSKEAGAKLKAMLEMGASRPWPDALEAVAGTRKMDARPMLEYFAPLRAYLAEQNAGRSCGWE